MDYYRGYKVTYDQNQNSYKALEYVQGRYITLAIRDNEKEICEFIDKRLDGN